MAINLGGLVPPTTGGTVTQGTNQVITLDLQKNDILNLTKREPGLQKVTLGAGWKVAATGGSFDLDISAFLLNQNRKISSGNDVIFFNHKTAPGVQLLEDNRTGAGEGDDEQIVLDLSQIPATVHYIPFAVTIADAAAKRQTFGMVEDSYVRLFNPLTGDAEICRFNLRENGSTATAVIFAELYRDGSEWQFKAIGECKVADLNGLCQLYQ